MGDIQITQNNGIAVITLARGKVNALNLSLTSELSGCLAGLADDKDVGAVILTGQGKFFSFGFDIPEMYDYSKEEFTRFLDSFCLLYKEMFLFPKPLIAAINGHAVAGGCILALTCDYRILVDGSAKMSLNEVTFGSSIFAGTVEMLRHFVGSRVAETVLLTGRMFDCNEALRMGLADELAGAENLAEKAGIKAQEMAKNCGPAFTSLKLLLRQAVVDEWSGREDKSIREFVEIWYSPETRENTKKILIHS